MMVDDELRTMCPACRMISAMHSLFSACCYCQLLSAVSWGEFVFFISCTMLDGGPRGFGMYLSILYVGDSEEGLRVYSTLESTSVYGIQFGIPPVSFVAYS